MRVYSPGYLLSGLLSVAIAAPASAQTDAVAMAESLFVRGRADMLAGRYETGCPALAESHRLDPRPGRLFTLPECEARRGRIATAVARYNDYLALYSRMSEAEQIKQHERYRVEDDPSRGGAARRGAAAREVAGPVGEAGRRAAR
ncbi:hypothetical protein WME89_08860 [Sorangium sp. So ce321]|uniref:hypothetical protein n=1 Tax=Sorangium sp. So ce321 TaxID=3133300 RepID=UPI003F5EDC7B